MTLSIKTLFVTLSIKSLFVTLSINDTQHMVAYITLHIEYHHAECRDLCIAMMSVVKLSVVMLNVVMLNVVVP